MLASIRVWFGYDLIKRLSGWTDEEMEENEGNLDHELFQALWHRVELPDGHPRAIAYYTMGNEDYTIEAYDCDGNPVEYNDTQLLEEVAREAISKLTLDMVTQVVI